MRRDFVGIVAGPDSGKTEESGEKTENIHRYLLDVNVLAALSSDEHEHYPKALNWFDSLANNEWATCPLTEAGYIRLAANPATRVGPGSIERTTEVLAEITSLPGYRYWPITDSWGQSDRTLCRPHFRPSADASLTPIYSVWQSRKMASWSRSTAVSAIWLEMNSSRICWFLNSTPAQFHTV